MSISVSIKNAALELGFDLVGIAPAGRARHAEAYAVWAHAGWAAEMSYMVRDVGRRQDITEWLPGTKSVVVVGLSYDDGEPASGVLNDPSRGRFARYAWGNDYHESMRPALDGLAGFIRQTCGEAAEPRVAVDTAPVLERDLAASAGLGFVGRNACLIHPVLGSYLFLAEIFVGVELGYDCPAVADGAELTWIVADGSCSTLAGGRAGGMVKGTCGECRRCLDACPTGALMAPYRLDARRCIAYQTIENKCSIPAGLRSLVGNWIFGCDICQMACPWTRRYGRARGVTVFPGDVDRVAPDLMGLMALSEADFAVRFRGTPVWRARRQGLLRNVAVAMGNWGDRAAIPALERACRDESPLVREHAEWALARIRRGRA